jgi:hypothetical protein
MTPRLALIPGGPGTVRKHLLSSPLRVWVVGLLLVPWTAGGCRPAQVPDGPGRDLVALDRLLRLMAQRLALMHDVARWKWNARQPVRLVFCTS